MKNRRSHIDRILACVLLWVFAIALTPWSSFHHHEEEQLHCNKEGKACAHKFHIGNESHNCLICSAHFEKDYHNTTAEYVVKLQSKAIVKNFSLITAAYVSLIATSLRGPPAAC